MYMMQAHSEKIRERNAEIRGNNGGSEGVGVPGRGGPFLFFIYSRGKRKNSHLSCKNFLRIKFSGGGGRREVCCDRLTCHSLWISIIIPGRFTLLEFHDHVRPVSYLFPFLRNTVYPHL